MILTVEEAADLLGVTPQRVRAMIAARRLPAKKIGRDWAIARQDLSHVWHRRSGRPSVQKGDVMTERRVSRKTHRIVGAIARNLKGLRESLKDDGFTDAQTDIVLDDVAIAHNGVVSALGTWRQTASILEVDTTD